VKAVKSNGFDVNDGGVEAAAAAAAMAVSVPLMNGDNSGDSANECWPLFSVTNFPICPYASFSLISRFIISRCHSWFAVAASCLSSDNMTSGMTLSFQRRLRKEPTS